MTGKIRTTAGSFHPMKQYCPPFVRMKHFCVAVVMLIAIAVVDLLATSTAHAAMLLADAVADYTPGINAGDQAVFGATGTGGWRYGSTGNGDGSGLIPLEWDPGFAAGVGVYEAFDANHADGAIDNVPFAIRSVGEIHMHPDLSERAVFEWTAGIGEAGPVDIVGNVRKIDTAGGDGIAFALYVDDVLLTGSAVAANDDVGVPFCESTVIGEGSIVRLVIDDGSQTLFDTSAFTMTVETPVPEPNSLALMSISLLGVLHIHRARLRRRPSLPCAN
jgi:hypothetical protein